MTRVLVGQHSALLGGALAAVLSGEQDLSVVAQLARGDEVLATASQERVHVAVLDSRLPGTVTVGEVCHALHRTVPACHPLVLVDRRGGDLARSLAALSPWLGLLSTDAAPADLVEAVRRMARGELPSDRWLADAMGAARANPLSAREENILRLARHGTPPKEIARQLGLSVGTVRNHLSRSVAKTGARTRLEAARIAQEAGWI